MTHGVLNHFQIVEEVNIIFENGWCLFVLCSVMQCYALRLYPDLELESRIKPLKLPHTSLSSLWISEAISFSEIKLHFGSKSNGIKHTKGFKFPELKITK